MLVQGMRQLQEVYLGRSEAKDGEMKVGTAELPMMPDFGPEAAVAYSDWLYEVEQGIGGLSDKASEWFGLCLRAAQEAYELYQMSDPLARLGMEPVRGPELPDPKWSRLERRVLTMMLDTLQRAAKDDAKTHRISTVPGLLFRLHVLYAPGSSAERAAILRQLDGVPGGSSLTDTVSTLRKWRRHLQRAQEMRVSIPDASILLRGIDTIATKAIDGQPDLKFRLSLTRTNLQLQYRPTLDGVMSYYNHVIAELQQAAPSRNPATPSTTTTSAGDAAKLKGNTTMGAGTGEIESPTRKGPNSSGTTKVPCKFFLADSGCTKGASCKFDHTFPSKEAKRLKCWFCGSTTHQQSSCPVKAGKSSPTKGRQGDRGATSTTSSSAPAATTASVNQTMVQHQQAILESLQGTTNSTATTASSTLITSTGATTGTSTGPQPTSTPTGAVADDERAQEISALLQQANTMLNKLTRLQAIQVRTDRSLQELSAQMEDLGFDESERLALLDSDASHPHRARGPEDQLPEQPVRVQLAGGQMVTLQQNKAGTLMPSQSSEGPQEASTILPMGALVEKLGCELSWTRRGGLRIVHPQYGPLKTVVKGNCPLLGETQALELIQQLEQRKLQELKQSTAETFIGTLCLSEVKDWDELLMKYVQGGERATSSLSGECGPHGGGRQGVPQGATTTTIPKETASIKEMVCQAI